VKKNRGDSVMRKQRMELVEKKAVMPEISMLD
jgi:hypothetical protein